MGAGSFFKLPEYNLFDYKPRFYDPDKEAREQRRIDLREELGKAPVDANSPDYKPGTTIKGSFKPKMPRRAFRSRNSTIRVFVIMAVLILFWHYILLISDLTPLIKYFK